MKKKFNLIIITLAVVAFVGCKDKLEEIVPQQSISDQLAFADETGATGATIGIYGLAQDLEVFGSMPAVISDFQSDNVNFIGSFPTLNAINNYATLANNASINGIWRDNFETILAANAVITNVPDVPGDGFTQAERDALIGEAKFMRAAVYFQMVNLFAHTYQIENGANDALPLITEPFTGEVVLYSRATLNEIHALIEQDLLDAITALPGDDLAPSRASVGAARTLLSRLYLYRGDFAAAATQASQVSGGTYVPAVDNGYWAAGGSEFLFTIVNTAVDNGETGSGGWNSYYEPAEQGGRGDCPFSADLLAAFDPADARLAFSEVGDNGETYTLKFNDASTDVSFVPVVRVTEAYLNHAEALGNTSGTITQEMVDLLNMSRTRAGLTRFFIADFATVGDYLTAVLNERRLELAFEGHRRMDLLRNGQNLRPAGDVDFTASAPGQDQTILPIPQQERDLNPNLTQNNGY